MPNTGVAGVDVLQSEVFATDAFDSFNIDLVVAAPPDVDGKAFDDLLKELEATPKGAAGLAEGRKWVARTFSDGQPTLANLRLSRGWSQKALAAAIQSSQSYIARLELGAVDPGIRMIRKISKALQLPEVKVFEAIARRITT